jgi:hypothetical protein
MLKFAEQDPTTKLNAIKTAVAGQVRFHCPLVRAGRN